MRPPKPSNIRDRFASTFRDMATDVGERDATMIAIEVLVDELIKLKPDRGVALTVGGICGVALWVKEERERNTLTADKLKAMYEALKEKPYVDPAVRVDGPDWWAVLGISRSASPAEVKAAYREKVKTAHPDQGGSEKDMKALNDARDEGLRARRP